MVTNLMKLLLLHNSGSQRHEPVFPCLIWSCRRKRWCLPVSIFKTRQEEEVLTCKQNIHDLARSRSSISSKTTLFWPTYVMLKAFNRKIADGKPSYKGMIQAPQSHQTVFRPQLGCSRRHQSLMKMMFLGVAPRNQFDTSIDFKRVFEISNSAKKWVECVR